MELIGCTRLYREKFNEEHFYNEDHVLLLVLEGGFFVKSEAGDFQVERLQGFHFHKGVTYERRITSPMTMLVFRYRSDAPLFEESHLVFKDTARVCSTVALFSSCENLADARKIRAHLLSDLANQYAVEQCMGEFHPVRDARILKAVQILRAADAAPSIAVLAGNCGLSHAQFIRLFKESLGKTPSDYIAAQKLERAMELLSQTDLSVKRISEMCGFENQYYFSNFFKRRVGCAPSVYRENMLSIL